MGAAELLNCIVGQLLHPALQAVGAGDLIALVAVEQIRDLPWCRPGPDVRAHLLELGFQSKELLPAPVVGLLQIDRCSEKVAGRQRVHLTPHRVLGRGVLTQFGPQEGSEVGVGSFGNGRRGAQLFAERSASLRRRGDATEVAGFVT